MCLKKILNKIFKKKIQTNQPVQPVQPAQPVQPTQPFIPTPAQVPTSARRQFNHLGCSFYIRKAYYINHQLRVIYDKDGDTTDDSYDFFQQICDLFKNVNPLQFHKWYK